MQSFATLLAFVSVLSSITFTNAHPGNAPEVRSADEQSVHTKRTLSATKCAPQARAMRESRKLARRGLTKRQGQTDPISVPEHAQELLNTTCVLAPETVEGPYYIGNEYVRPDLREDQAGVELILDIGLLDINTCEPISNAFVEIWSCNSVGAYGGYTTAPPLTGPPPAGTEPSTVPLTDNLSWLRGGMATNPKGIVELTTLYPGWYTGRTVHIHTMVHTNYTIEANGTLVSGEGKMIHIGQVFYEDDLTTQIGALSPYNTNTQPRTINPDDSIFLEENSAGNNAIAEHSLLGATIEDGVLSYITIGVDTSASYEITNTNVQLPK